MHTSVQIHRVYCEPAVSAGGASGIAGTRGKLAAVSAVSGAAGSDSEPASDGVLRSDGFKCAAWATFISAMTALMPSLLCNLELLGLDRVHTGTTWRWQACNADAVVQLPLYKQGTAVHEVIRCPTESVQAHAPA